MLFDNRTRNTETSVFKWSVCKKHNLSSIAFVLGLSFLFSLLSGFFSQLQLSYIISSDSKELLNTYSMKVERFPEALTSLSKNFQFDCSPLDQHQLEHIAYNDYVIRRITIKSKNGKQCSSFKGGDVEARLAPLINNLAPNISLWVASESRSEQNLLVAEWQGEQGTLLVHLEPLISETLRNKYCDNCVLSSISSIESPTVSYWRGDASLLANEPLFSSDFSEGVRVNTFVKKKSC